jgi:hypothetical protein
MIRPAARWCCIHGCTRLPGTGVSGSGPGRRIGHAPRARTSVASATSSGMPSPADALPLGRRWKRISMPGRARSRICGFTVRQVRRRDGGLSATKPWRFVRLRVFRRLSRRGTCCAASAPIASREPATRYPVAWQRGVNTIRSRHRSIELLRPSDCAITAQAATNASTITMPLCSSAARAARFGIGISFMMGVPLSAFSLAAGTTAVAKLGGFYSPLGNQIADVTSW